MTAKVANIGTVVLMMVVTHEIYASWVFFDFEGST